MKYYIFLSLFLLFSCIEDPEIPELKSNLQEYIDENSSFGLVRDSLIACALGGSNVLLTKPDAPISILFYPKGDASEFQYFESTSASIDPNDYSNYERQELPEFPVFNSYLRGFEREESGAKWGLVTYLKDGEINISNPIRLKFEEKPTEDNPDLLNINTDDQLSPLFTWEDGQIDENVIFFQVILDSDGDLLTGTYTLENSFKFYDLSNVVLNIRDVNPAPSLIVGEEYTFVLMGVSIDNWVNLIFEKDFIAQ